MKIAIICVGVFTLRFRTVPPHGSSNKTRVNRAMPHHMGSVSVSSCRCCMPVSCVHLVAVLNTAFCMTCSLLMLLKDARGDHMEEAYSSWSHDCLVVSHEYLHLFTPFCTLWWVFLLFVETCVRVLRCCECVCLPRPFGCVTMGNAVLFICIFHKVWYEQSASFFCLDLVWNCYVLYTGKYLCRLYEFFDCTRFCV